MEACVREFVAPVVFVSKFFNMKRNQMRGLKKALVLFCFASKLRLFTLIQANIANHIYTMMRCEVAGQGSLDGLDASQSADVFAIIRDLVLKSDEM